MWEILNDGKRLGKSLKRLEKRRKMSGKSRKMSGKRRKMLGKSRKMVNGWYGWFFSWNFMGKWSVSKGWEFPAMLPEDINVDSQAMYIFYLIQDGCTMMYWCYWSSPCLVHVMQSHRCEKAKVEQYESLSSNLWEPKAIGFFQPEAAQRLGKSVRMSFSFMFIWKPPIFCWFPSASFSSNCVYVFFLGVRCHSICWSNRIPVTTCDSSVTAAVSLMPVHGRCQGGGWNFVWRYVVDWKGNLMTVVLSWSKRILLNTLTRKIKMRINLVPQIPVFIQYSNIYPSYVPLISFNYLTYPLFIYPMFLQAGCVSPRPIPAGRSDLPSDEQWNCLQSRLSDVIGTYPLVI